MRCTPLQANLLWDHHAFHLSCCPVRSPWDESSVVAWTFFLQNRVVKPRRQWEEEASLEGVTRVLFLPDAPSFSARIQALCLEMAKDQPPRGTGFCPGTWLSRERRLCSDSRPWQEREHMARRFGRLRAPRFICVSLFTTRTSTREVPGRTSSRKGRPVCDGKCVEEGVRSRCRPSLCQLLLNAIRSWLALPRGGAGGIDLRTAFGFQQHMK